jgi:hypothetical protein
MMKKIKTLCGVLALLCVGMMPVSAQNVLKFNADKKFKIVQFTDVHWVPGDSASEEAAERMNEVLDVEKPDLVIYTGDLVFGKPEKRLMISALMTGVIRLFLIVWLMIRRWLETVPSLLPVITRLRPMSLWSC